MNTPRTVLPPEWELLLPPGRSRVLDALRSLREPSASGDDAEISDAAGASCVLFEPPTPLSIAGAINQAVNPQQIIDTIVRLCTDGMTFHTRNARTLWFAMRVAADIGCPYRIYRLLAPYGVTGYLLIRTDLEGISVPAADVGCSWELVVGDAQAAPGADHG